MFGFVKQIFVSAIMFFGCNVSSVNSSKCISMNNEECKIRPEIININSNELLFYLYSIKVNKYNGSCNNINDPNAKLCVPDVFKTMNIKVFNLIPRTNETRHVKWHETNCECECDKSCDVGEYLDYVNCKGRKRLIDKLVEEFSEITDEKKLHSNEINAILLNTISLSI